MKKIVFLCLILCLIGCESLELKTYVSGDRATYDVIAGDYSDYVAADEKLDEDQKKRRQTLIQTWEKRIKAAEDE